MSVDSMASPISLLAIEEENATLKAENKRLMSLVSKQREKIREARLSPTPMDEDNGGVDVENGRGEPKEQAMWPVDDGRHPHGKPKDEMTVRYRFADYLMHELVKRRVSKK